MARRFTRPRGRLGSVRQTSWVAMPASVTNLSVPNTASLILVAGAGLLAARPFTIVRTHLFFGIRTDQVSTDESFDAAIGFAVVSDQAVAIGVTAIPTPFTDLGSDFWLLHSILMGRFDTLSQVGYQPDMLVSEKIDSKAMRKVNDDQDIVVVIENSSVSLGVTVHVAGRFLIKES